MNNIWYYFFESVGTINFPDNSIDPKRVFLHDFPDLPVFALNHGYPEPSVPGLPVNDITLLEWSVLNLTDYMGLSYFIQFFLIHYTKYPYFVSPFNLIGR